MKFSYKIITATCLILIFSSVLTAQQVNEVVKVKLLNYLTGYCEEGEENTFIHFIQKNQSEVQAMLMKFINEDVPENLIDSLKRGALQQYENRQKLLSQDLDFGLGKEDFGFIRKQSMEDFTNKKIEDFRNGFMSQAIFGLSLINSYKAQALVKEIADDGKNPYQRSAQNALNKVYLKK